MNSLTDKNVDLKKWTGAKFGGSFDQSDPPLATGLSYCSVTNENNAYLE